MGRVHVVELGFKLEAQLHFFFVVLSVLQIVFFQFEPHLSLIHPFALNFLAVLLQRILVFL